MQRVVTKWNEFQNAWDGVLNFLMSGECVPFSFEFPPLETIVEELRADALTHINPGTKGASLNMQSIANEFRALPLNDAMQAQFSLAHYRLSQFDTPGKFLHGFKERVLIPWQDALRTHDFTWQRC